MKERSLKKVYIKKFSKISGFKVWIVDGKYIRGNIDKEFTNYGQHYRFKFIPPDEFWIDKERYPGEEKYFIYSMLVMNRMISRGMSYKKASKLADKIEQKKRNNSKLIKKGIKSQEGRNNLIRKIHKELIKKYSKGKIKVWIVRGELVRGLFFLDFTEGGHDKVYSFVPKNQIWIDDDLDDSEIKFVLLHEIHERNLMAKGMRYDEAHNLSSEIEYSCRKNPKLLEGYLKKEFKKSMEI